MFDPQDTICAVASPPGPALRGVVRISGPESIALLSRVCAPSGAPGSPLVDVRTGGRPCRRRAYLDVGPPIGSVLTSVLLWPSNRSYTGQPSAELHLIGSEPILQAVIDLLIQHGARIAARGEFTLRSFLAGHLDLVQAEAVLGVIEADTSDGLNVALDQLTGGVSYPLKDLRRQMLDLLADVEAGLDFVDEDIQFIADAELAQRLNDLSHAIHMSADQMSSRARAGDCPVVALRGLPNAGKSRLMNALTGMESSIVSDRVGTTRDPVEVRLDFGTQAMRIVDTAGIETPRDADGSRSDISDQAQQIGQALAERADVRLWCRDATQAIDTPRISQAGEIRVATKVDLIDGRAQRQLEREGWMLTSAATGLGLEALIRAVCHEAGSSDRDAGVAATAARCRETLVDAARGLAAAAEVSAAGSGHELVAAEIRMALDAVGRVTGTVYTDDILDSIFSRFCIGK